jgi:hypothetical protein
MSRTTLSRFLFLWLIPGCLGTEDPDIATAAQPIAFRSCGVTAADGALAARLNPQLHAKMAGFMDAETVACARVIVRTVQSRGLDLRAAQIAVTTTIVESSIHNYTVAVDHDSLGLFQQRPSAGWGTPAQVTDPVYATNAFLNHMLANFPNNRWETTPIGEVCQGVQISAFPDRYQVQAADAGVIAAALFTAAAPPADWYVLSGDWDGNGTRTPGFYNVRTHRWILSNHNSGGGVDADFGWGGGDQLPVVGDWDGNGTTTPGLYNPQTHVWTLSNFNAAHGVDAQFGWGGDGGLPIAGDWDGDGHASIGLFFPATRRWVLANHNSGGGVDADFGWGPPGLIPVVGDWNGDGTTTPGFYNPTTHAWTLSNFNAGHGVDYDFGWGGGDQLPVVGDWNGDGTTTPGLFRNDVFTLSNHNSGGGVDAQFGWGPNAEFTVVGAL